MLVRCPHRGFPRPTDTPRSKKISSRCQPAANPVGDFRREVVDKSGDYSNHCGHRVIGGSYESVSELVTMVESNNKPCGTGAKQRVFLRAAERWRCSWAADYTNVGLIFVAIPGVPMRLQMLHRMCRLIPWWYRPNPGKRALV